MPDPNFPGMRVCKEDLDNFDPWRLPALQTENIALRFPRPDVSVATGPIGGDNILTENGFTAQNDIYITGTDGTYANGTGDLNKNSNVVPSPMSLNPYIYNVTPNVGSKSGGTNVVITGANFTEVNTIRFGGVIAIFELVNSTEITAVVPAYSTIGVVDVLAVSPFGNATFHGGFTYTA
jgi:hypothetical protein